VGAVGLMGRRIMFLDECLLNSSGLVYCDLHVSTVGGSLALVQGGVFVWV